MRIRELGAAGTFVKGMFDFVANEIYGVKYGARYKDPTVKKVNTIDLVLEELDFSRIVLFSGFPMSHPLAIPGFLNSSCILNCHPSLVMPLCFYNII